MTLIYHGPKKAQWYSSLAQHHRLCSELNGRHIQDYLVSDVYRSQGQHISPLVVADFGTGDGILALSTIMPVIETQRKENKGVVVILNDQSGNEWQKLQETLKEFKIDERNDVIVYVSTKDFNKQCAPTGFVDFGIAVLANQYIPDLCMGNDIFTTGKNVTYEEHQRISDQFERCWKHFLMTRSSEIKLGGRLSCSFVMVGSHDGGRYLQMMSDVWTKMYTEGIINQHEYNKAVIHSSLAEKSDILEPFKNNVFAGFEIMSFKTNNLRANWQDSINEISDPTDPDSARHLYAEKYATFVQSWSRASMASAMVNFRSSEDV